MDTLNPNQMPPMGTAQIPENKSKGPLIAVIVILALIIIGGLYFLKERSSQEVYVPPTNTEETDSVTASLQTQSSSDDLGSIEADLEASNYDNLDEGASVIQSEMQ